MNGFKMGTLDHMHLVVSDRYEAARWFQQHLGFEIVAEYEVWAKVTGGPLHISADGGRSGLALFERGPHHDFRVETSVAFRVDAQQFVVFAEGLEASTIRDLDGRALRTASVVDHDLCYTFYLQDPYGNQFELDCYDHETVKRDLVEKRGIVPIRFW